MRIAVGSKNCITFSANVTSFIRKTKKKKSRRKKDFRLLECFVVDENMVEKTADYKKIVKTNSDIYGIDGNDWSFSNEPGYNDYARSVGAIFRKHGESTLRIGTAFVVGLCKPDSKYKAIIMSCAHTCRSSATMEEESTLLDDCVNEKYLFILSGNLFNDVSSSIDFEKEKEIMNSTVYVLESLYGVDGNRSFKRHVHPSNENIVHSISGDVAVFGIIDCYCPKGKIPYHNLSKVKCLIPCELPAIQKNTASIDSKVIGYHHGMCDDELEWNDIEIYGSDRFAPTFLLDDFKDYLSQLKFGNQSFSELDNASQKQIKELIVNMANANFPIYSRCILMTSGEITNHKPGYLAIAGISTETGMSGAPLVPANYVKEGPLLFWGFLVGCCIFGEDNTKLNDYIYFIQRDPKKLDNQYLEHKGKKIEVKRNQDCLELLVSALDNVKPCASLDEILEGNAFISCVDPVFIEAYNIASQYIDYSILSEEEKTQVLKYLSIYSGGKFISNGVRDELQIGMNDKEKNKIIK